MADKRIRRKLAALLSVDIVGCSAQIRENEQRAPARPKALRNEVIDSKIAECGGRLFKAMGDGVLVEYPIALGAVQFATNVRTALRARNVDLSGQPLIEVRLGIKYRRCGC